MSIETSGPSRAVLVAGAEGRLGAHIAARLLLQTSTTVYCLTPPGSREQVLHQVEAALATQGCQEPRELARELLHVLDGEVEDAAPPGPGLRTVPDSLEAVWNTGPDQGLTGRTPPEAHARRLHRLFRLLEGCQVRVFNHVGCFHPPLLDEFPQALEAPGAPGMPHGQDEQDAEQQVRAWCQAAGTPLRLFRTSQLVHEQLQPEACPPASLPRFLADLFRFKEYLDDKLPGFAAKTPLRLRAAPEAGVNVLRLEDAVSLMLRVAGRPESSETVFTLAGPRNLSLAGLCKAVEKVAGLKLTPVPMETPLEPADTLLELRAGGFKASHLQALPSPSLPAAAPGGMEGGQLVAATGVWEEALVAELHGRWEAARQMEHHLARQAFKQAQRRVLTCEDGSPLEYFVAGERGPALICINALGQDLIVWRWLLVHFAKNHRVICWKPRGTYEGRWRSLQEQLADLERIIAHENVQECRLLTWCSGLKTGVEFARRSRLVSALVVMNGAFKAIQGLEHFETRYEKDMLKLCRMVAQRQELAPMLMKSVKALLTGLVSAREGNASALEVLSSGSQDLTPMLTEPFEDVRSMINYSFQVVDYLSHDLGPALAALSVPTLILSGQFDRISSPDMSRAVSKRLPMARYSEVAGGTHYSLYEAPEAVIEFIDHFFETSLGPAAVDAR